MNPVKLPKKLDFGAGNLVELEYLQEVFKIPRVTARLYLKALRIKPMYIGSEMYFSLPTFNRIMFVLSRPGAPGFLWPGSKGKQWIHNKKKEGYLTEVTNEIIAQASNPAILAEMAAASGNDPTLVRMFAPSKTAKKKEPK